MGMVVAPIWDFCPILAPIWEGTHIGILPYPIWDLNKGSHIGVHIGVPYWGPILGFVLGSHIGAGHRLSVSHF